MKKGGTKKVSTKKSSTKKVSISTIILILVFLVGLSLLLYPTVSDFWNSLHQSRAITEYTQQVANLNNDRYEQLWQDAVDYNKTLLTRANRYELSEEEQAEYESLLNASDNGVIGYIRIPSIDCSLPIYHGTDAAVLQVGVGHLEGSSLPVGGESTHAVISGHRGLPSSRLFTDLDQVEIGDTFDLHVLDEVLTYEVDQILVVEPQDLEALDIVEGEDYCTLVTCTPYGVNTHRLLVRGHRTENADETADQTGAVSEAANAVQVEPIVLAPLVVIPLMILLAAGVLLKTRRKK